MKTFNSTAVLFKIRAKLKDKKKKDCDNNTNASHKGFQKHFNPNTHLQMKSGQRMFYFALLFWRKPNKTLIKATAFQQLQEKSGQAKIEIRLKGMRHAGKQTIECLKSQRRTMCSMWWTHSILLYPPFQTFMKKFV